jgi:anti-sigma factor RsiW
MTGGTHIPGSPACNEWEAQLTDALDGLLSPEEEARFVAHRLMCPACAEMYEDARKGRQWLEFLLPEPEPPEGLLEKILATTEPRASRGADLGRAVSGLPAAAGAVPVFVPTAWQQPGFLGWMRTSAQPRMLMTAAMAFFSIALTLNLAGVDVRNLRLADLRPRAVRSYMERQLTTASVPVVRYYDHLRFVHEFAARVRELRNQNESEDNGGGRPQPRMQPGNPGESRVTGKRGTQQRTVAARDPGEKRRHGRRDAILAENARAEDGAQELFEASAQFSFCSTDGSEECRSRVRRMLERSTPWSA